MLLNKTYYQTLWDKYKGTHILCELKNNSSSLTLKIIIEHCRNKQSVHFNIQNDSNILSEVSRQLFIELSNDIFCNAVDFPPFNDGDKVRSKKLIRVGKPKPLFLDFTLKKLPDGRFKLYNKKFELTIEKKFDELVQQFIPLTQNAHNATLKKFTSYFETLNGRQIHDFTPAYFERKSVFIAPKTFYDSLEVKNKIPITYFPNPREESNPHETKSIRALPDSIMYFVPKYKVCYDKIFRQGKKIDTVVVYDTEETEIEQIIQDKNRFGFNLIVITNSTNPIKCSQVPCWNWFKEEIDIINSL